MLTNRKKQLLVTLLAVLSMFVSAVSACACSHHEPEQTDVETSCHDTTLEAAETPVQETHSDRVDYDCRCFVKNSVPAIIAKTDDKRTTIAKQIVDGDAAVLIDLAAKLVRIEISSVSESNDSFYKQDLLSSLPSRAPPRL